MEYYFDKTREKKSEINSAKLIDFNYIWSLAEDLSQAMFAVWGLVF